MKPLFLATLMLPWLALAACGNDDSAYAFTALRGNVPVLDPADVDPQLFPAAIRAQKTFAIGLHQAMTTDATPVDLVFSPFSIFTAFDLLYPGARGDTAALMRTGFFLEGTDDQILDGQGALYQSILAGSTTGARLESANGLFVGKQFTLKQDYLDAVTRAFDATTYHVDFLNDCDTVRQDINRWVSDRTAGHIPALLPANVVSADTDMVLVNALYFKGRWKKVFEEGDRMFFHGKAGDRAFVPMVVTLENGAYGEGPVAGAPDETIQVLPIPYQDYHFDLVVMLPSDFDAFLATLNADTFAAYLELGYSLPGGYNERIVYVKMPSFTTRTRLSLKAPLAALGLGDLFCDATPRPDFSGLWGGDTCVRDVLHEVYIDVNLKGTEAAAATTTPLNNVNNIGGPEYFYFHADRPFLYALVDRATKVPLFLGQLVN